MVIVLDGPLVFPQRGIGLASLAVGQIIVRRQPDGLVIVLDGPLVLT